MNGHYKVCMLVSGNCFISELFIWKYLFIQIYGKFICRC